jgi:hypothetical protein
MDWEWLVFLILLFYTNLILFSFLQKHQFMMDWEGEEGEREREREREREIL